MTGERGRGWLAGLCGLEGSPRHRLKITEYVPSRKATFHTRIAKWGAQTSSKVEPYLLQYVRWNEFMLSGVHKTESAGEKVDCRILSGMDPQRERFAMLEKKKENQWVIENKQFL